MDSLSDDELLLYSRQILLDGWDLDAQLCLRSSTVLMVGMGGLGCPVAQILTRAGVGSLTLVDFDVIEISNLQRQSLFTHDDLGKNKAHTAKTRLHAHNPLVRIDSHALKITPHSIDELLSKHTFDLVIDGTDNFAVRDALNRACRHHHVPLLSNSAIGEVGQIALFTHETGCYHCLFGGEYGDEQTCATSGVLASTVHIIGSMTAQIALDFLGRKVNPIAHELLIWQGRQMTLRKVRFHPDPDCPICKNKKTP